jgi:hypothetical protein
MTEIPPDVVARIAGTMSEIETAQRHLALLRRALTGERLARAVLLFHRGGPWTDADRVAWLELTGQQTASCAEATTKVLGDLAREVLAQRDTP